MAIKAPKGAGSKLGRTETVSIRLDPRLNYLCELAARSQRRTKSSFIEATLAEHIQTQVINKWRNSDFDEPNTFGERADVLWHVRESQHRKHQNQLYENLHGAQQYTRKVLGYE